MSFTEITPYDGQLPSSSDPASFDGRASALMSWLVANFAPEIQALAVEIATALNGEEDTLAAVQALSDSLKSAAHYNANGNEDFTVDPNALPTRAAVAAAIASMGGNQSGSAPVFGVRAWANFDGMGSVTIKSSGNISSITRNSSGNYTVNFATALPNANYAVAGMAASSNGRSVQLAGETPDGSTGATLKTASACCIEVVNLSASAGDNGEISFIVVG